MAQLKTAIFSPAPPAPLRNRGKAEGDASSATVFDIDALLTVRAQRMLASSSSSSPVMAVKTPKPPHRHPEVAESALVSSSNCRAVTRYPLQWDVRAVPLLCFAESEARGALVKLEREHCIGLLASMHTTKVMCFYREQFETLEKKTESFARRDVYRQEHESRKRLWQGHEELIVTQQLRELDIDRDAALWYMHRPSVAAASSSAPSIEFPESAVEAAVANHQDDWVLHITYLITYDLAMMERKERIAMLRDEMRTRSTLADEQKSSVVGARQNFQSRRHRERCEYYRNEVRMQVSSEMMEEHLVSHVFEEWMWVTHTLFVATLLDEHLLILRFEMLPKVQLVEQKEARRKLEAREQWHRREDVEASEREAFIVLTARYYLETMKSIFRDEGCVWRSAFAPWIAGARALKDHTALRLASAVRIQRCFRAVRLGLKGRRVTNTKIGNEIRLARREKARTLDRQRAANTIAAMEMELLTLELVDGCVDSACNKHAHLV